MEQVSGENSCGSTIATTIFCSVFVVLVSAISFWAIYNLYWKRKYGANRLIVEDPENAKVDYAFDNPAFKAGDNSKNVSPFDNKWRTPDKRKTVDDSYTNAHIPRLVSLRGSDFTGLGIEVCGGLKEGIFVKKVMPQGPAANIVHRGDKITSITIDFRHIVQEDAATILSYASPYNVQLELIEPSGAMSNFLTQYSHQSLLAHPLYRSRSQENLETIERNARKKLFTNDENSYPTLKMDQQQNSFKQKRRSPIEIIHTRDEHEKKKSLKKIQNFIIDMVEEKCQTKSHSPNVTDSKKNIKFFTPVLPNEITKGTVNSPNKIQADNDNNTNMEKIDIQPPEAMKRSKNKNSNPKKNSELVFERQASINSSGIVRNSAGIPQEMPTELMQAAITALNYRKVNSIDRKYKGMDSRPPNVDVYDTVDHVIKITEFDGEEPSMKLNSSECSGHDADKLPSTDQNNIIAQPIELSSNYVTVHQVSQEETSEERKAASLGDLSKLGVGGYITVSKTNDGNLERARSLEISDSVSEKINNVDSDGTFDLKAPCLSELPKENMEALQTARLKSSYEWGNLEDVIYDGNNCLNNKVFDKKKSSSSMDMMLEVLAAADKFDYEINDIQLSDIIDDDLSKFELELSKTIDSNDTDSYVKSLPQRIKDEPVSFTISQKSNDVLDAHEEASMLEEYEKAETPESISTTQSVHINHSKSTDVNSPKSLCLETRDLDTGTETTSINTNSSSEAIHEIGVGNDTLISKYALSNIETPNSEVLKKLISHQLPDGDFKNRMDSTSSSHNTLMARPIDETVLDINEIEPIKVSVPVRTESNTEESLASPIFSSDLQGVSNICISSTDSNLSNQQQLLPYFTNFENISHVVGGDISQPSSITMEDEQIDFKMQAVNDDIETDSVVSSIKNEVFIVESLSSKKLQNSLLSVNNDNSESKTPTRGFVTEIRLPNSNKDKQMNGQIFSKSLKVQNEDNDPLKKSILNTNCKSESRAVIFQEDYTPRNSEIRFTQSTYQSPRQFEKRSSQIDQIRSNFERSHTSEIPVPIRKMSTSSTPPPSSHSANIARVSPSKIPVFTSQKSSENIRNNANMNRVSIISIKNSSRNPSGK